MYKQVFMISVSYTTKIKLLSMPCNSMASGLHHDHQPSKMWCCRALTPYSIWIDTKIGMTMTHWKTNLLAARSVCNTVKQGAGRDQNWQLSLWPLKLHYYLLVHFLRKWKQVGVVIIMDSPGIYADSANIKHPQEAGPQGIFGVQTQLIRTILRLMLSRHAAYANTAWGETHTNAILRVSVHQSSSHTCPVLYTHADTIWSSSWSASKAACMFPIFYLWCYKHSTYWNGYEYIDEDLLTTSSWQ